VVDKRTEPSSKPNEHRLIRSIPERLVFWHVWVDSAQCSTPLIAVDRMRKFGVIAALYTRMTKGLRQYDPSLILMNTLKRPSHLSHQMLQAPRTQKHRVCRGGQCS